MGEIVPHGGGASSTLALALHQKDPEVLEAEQAKRIEEANKLEEKLKIIQESVPTRIYNTTSSSAGAGSSDFHMYRMIRKAEQERWKRIEATNKAAEEQAVFEERKREREKEADERTAKNRAKRAKKKAKKKQSKPGGAGGQEPSGTGDDDDDDEEKGKDAAPEQAALD